MLHIELDKNKFETLMFITNGKQVVNKNDIMVYIENFFTKEDVKAIKISDSQLLCFSEVC